MHEAVVWTEVSEEVEPVEPRDAERLVHGPLVLALVGAQAALNLVQRLQESRGALQREERAQRLESARVLLLVLSVVVRYSSGRAQAEQLVAAGWTHHVSDVLEREHSALQSSLRKERPGVAVGYCGALARNG